MWCVFVIANKLAMKKTHPELCVITHMHNVKLRVIIEQSIQVCIQMQSVFYMYIVIIQGVHHNDCHTSKYRLHVKHTNA